MAKPVPLRYLGSITGQSSCVDPLRIDSPGLGQLARVARRHEKMAVVWRVVALTVVVASCIGQGVPISFGEDPNKPLQRHDPCVERSSGRPVDGVCRPMQECPLAMEAYTTVGVTMVTTCGFEGVTRIVCCPKGGTGTVSLESLDISSPYLDFECGKRPSRIRQRVPGNFGPLPPYVRNQYNQGDFSRPWPPNGFAGVGGTTPRPNSWPWAALMGWSLPNGTIWWRCGAALINRQWVVTAAHCFDKGDPQVVRLGEHDYSNFYGPHRQDFKIRRYLLHPEYSIVSSYHDIALVELDRPVQLKPQVAPVCLPWGSESLKDLTRQGQGVTLTGWGATQHGSGLSSVLQKVPLSVFASEVCDTSYRVLPGFELEFPRGINRNDFVCAGDIRGGRDACSGDSGSPITYFNRQFVSILAGVVSKGYGCGLIDFPGLYTPLHRGEYLDWIKRNAFA